MLREIVKRTPLLGPTSRHAAAALRRADRSLGRRLYRDEDKLSYHVRLEGALRRVRAASTYRPQKSGAFPPEQLEQKGIVGLHGLYSPALVETIRAKVTAALDDPSKRVPRQGPAPDGEQYTWYLKDPHRVVPELCELLTRELLASIEDYYRAHLDVRTVKVWRNVPVPAEVRRRREMYSSHWHCDRERPPGLVKIFYLVHDTRDEDGPLLFQPRPRTRELFRRGWRNRNDYALPASVMEDRSAVFRATGPAGSAFICNTTNCLHRAGEVAPGHYRDIVQFQLVPATDPLPESWLDARRCRIGEGEMSRALYDTSPDG